MHHSLTETGAKVKFKGVRLGRRRGLQTASALKSSKFKVQGSTSKKYLPRTMITSPPLFIFLGGPKVLSDCFVLHENHLPGRQCTLRGHQVRSSPPMDPAAQETCEPEAEGEQVFGGQEGKGPQGQQPLEAAALGEPGHGAPEDHGGRCQPPGPGCQACTQEDGEAVHQ